MAELWISRMTTLRITDNPTSMIADRKNNPMTGKLSLELGTNWLIRDKFKTSESKIVMAKQIFSPHAFGSVNENSAITEKNVLFFLQITLFLKNYFEIIFDLFVLSPKTTRTKFGNRNKTSGLWKKKGPAIAYCEFNWLTEEGRGDRLRHAMVRPLTNHPWQF